MQLQYEPEYEPEYEVATLPNFGLEFVVGSVPCPPALRADVALMERLIEQYQLPIAHVFNAPLFTGEQRSPGPEPELEWRFMPLDEDPLYKERRRFPFPEDVLMRLRNMERAGIRPDSFYIAHSVSMGSTPHTGRSTLAELQPPPARKSVQASAQMGGIARQLFSVATLPFLGAMAGLTVAAGAAAAIGQGLAALDPILFAVIADPEQGVRPGAVAAWYVVACWVYE